MMRLKPLHALLAGALLATPLAYAAGDAAKSQQYGATAGAAGTWQQDGQLQQSQAVLKVQQELNQRGYEAGPEDGLLGKRTRSAIEDFQRAQGMQATGELGRDTIEALGFDTQEAEFAAFVEQTGQQDGMQQDDAGMAPSPMRGEEGDAGMGRSPGSAY